MSQARRLEGQVFCVAHNNGVQAIMREESIDDGLNDDQRYEDITQALRKLPGSHRMLVDRAVNGLRSEPIFTFANTNRVEREPWFTGDHALLVILLDYIREQGGQVNTSKIYVPFSSGKERNFGESESFVHELSYVTSARQFFDTFGISLVELKSRALAEV